MARVNLDAWVPEERDSAVIQTVRLNSAVEAVARRVNMHTDTLKAPRLAETDVQVLQKGEVYPEDQPVVDNVLLDAVKFGDRIIIAEEDLADSALFTNAVANLQQGWATSYATMIDNACLGTIGAASANQDPVPFNSVYREVTANAAANKTAVNTAGVTYAALSGALAAVEGGSYHSDADMVIVAHPRFKFLLRTVYSAAGAPVLENGLKETLFGYDVVWSRGAKTSTVATKNPDATAPGIAGAAGNPLLIVGNRQHLILGVRSGPESIVSYDAGFGTDEAHLKMRARRAFAVGRPGAFGILEVTA